MISHVDDLGTYQGKIRSGAHWVEQLVSNFSQTNILNAATPTSPSTPELLQVVIEAKKDYLGGLITLINSIISNTKHEVHFYIIIPSNALQHLQ